MIHAPELALQGRGGWKVEADSFALRLEGEGGRRIGAHDHDADPACLGTAREALRLPLLDPLS